MNMLWKVAAILLALAGAANWLISQKQADGANYVDRIYSTVFEETTEQASWQPNSLTKTEDYTFYREQIQEIEAPLFGRSLTLPVVEAAGNILLPFAQRSLLGGNAPAVGECLIDEESAYKLWGDAVQAPGNHILLEDEEYTIAGVVAQASPFLIVHRQEGSFQPQGVWYRPPAEAPYPRQSLDSFLQALPLRAGRTRDMSRWHTGLEVALRIPSLVFLMMVAFSLFGRVIPHPIWLRIALWLLLGWFCGRLLGIPHFLTPDMLPGQWSNFAFWGQRWEALQAAWWDLWGSSMPFPERLWSVEFFSPVLWCSALSLPLYGASFVLWRRG